MRAISMNNEHNLQGLCVRWFRKEYPHLLIFHVPNGGTRNIIEAKRLKDIGVVAGIPDLIIPIPSYCGTFHSLYIELKVGKNKTTKKQEDIHDILASHDNIVLVCSSFEDFKEIIKKYFNKDEKVLDK